MATKKTGARKVQATTKKEGKVARPNGLSVAAYIRMAILQRVSAGSSGIGRRWEMSTITKRLTVDQYDQMVENGILPETNRFELIKGRIVEKDMKGSLHRVAVQRTLQEMCACFLPAGTQPRKSLFASRTGGASRSLMSPSFGARSTITPTTTPGPRRRPGRGGHTHHGR